MKKKSLLLTAVATLGLTAATMAQNVPNYVPINGLIGWWPFNGNANDESGNGNNGTVSGATLSIDRLGNINNAYFFDGIDDKIECGFVPNSNFSSNASWSYSLWMNPNGIKYGRLLSFTSNNSGGDLTFVHQLVFDVDNKLYFNCAQFTGQPNAPYVMPVSQVLPLNVWHHVIIEYSNNIASIYINSVLSATAAYNGPLSLDGSNSELHIGYIPNEPLYRFAGKQDDIGIWNRALTPCEIKKLYTSGSFSVSSSSSNTICVGQSLNLTAAGASTYTWSTGATSQSISVSPTVSTVYTVSTTYSLGCTDSRTFSITVNACTGLNEAESVINSVLIFPNPAKEYVSITAHSALIGKVYSINDHLGKHIATGILSAEKTTISLHGLAKGFYFLNVDGKNYKIIKD